MPPFVFYAYLIALASFSAVPNYSLIFWEVSAKEAELWLLLFFRPLKGHFRNFLHAFNDRDLLLYDFLSQFCCLIKIPALDLCCDAIPPFFIGWFSICPSAPLFIASFLKNFLACLTTPIYLILLSRACFFQLYFFPPPPFFSPALADLAAFHMLSSWPPF